MRKAIIITLSVLLLLGAGSFTYIYFLLDRVNENPLVEIPFEEIPQSIPDEVDDEGEPDVTPSEGSEPAKDIPLKKLPPPRPLTPEELGITPQAPKEPEVINILLFGVDRRSKNERSRSDSIMIVSLDKKSKAIKMTSLMRDIYLDIPGRDANRINAAYAFGGPALAIKTINTNFNMNIQYYMTVDFFGLSRIIDKLGGISIDINKDEFSIINGYIRELNRLDKDTPDAPLLTEPGLQLLTGKQAVAYSRIRKVGNGDFERTERQRTVLNLMIQKAKHTNVFELPGLVSDFLPFVETNLSKSQMLSLGITAFNLRNSDILSCRLPADGTYKNSSIRGMSVLEADMDKNVELLHQFVYGSRE